MKIVKSLVLIIAILILAGCNAEFNVNLTPNLLTEKIVIEKKKSNIFSNTLNEDLEAYKSQLELYGYQYSVKSRLFEEVLTISRTVVNGDNLNLFTDEYANIIYMGLDNNSVLYSVSDINVFELYPELTSVDFVINTKYKVVRTNADRYENGNYYWHLTKENDDITIEIMINNEIDETIKDDKSNGNSQVIFAGVLMLAFLCLLFIMYIIKNIQTKKIRYKNYKTL